jgi:AcrR family transcriptional regulator
MKELNERSINSVRRPLARLAGSAGERTAEAIRKESLLLIARHGYDAVSMRMIAEAVGVQPGALYQYFTNKQQLLVTLLREHMERLLEAWSAERVENEEPKAALERFARFHIRYHFSRADEVFISYMELRALEPMGFKLIGALRKVYEKGLKDVLIEGHARGAFNLRDPHAASMAILSMLTGVSTWYRTGGRLSQQEIEDIYACMVLGSVGCSC